MFYRLNKARHTKRLDRAISGIFDTPPIVPKDAPWCIVSMVANGDVPTYLLAIKSFYRALGRGKVAAIVDRDMPQPLRDMLNWHVPGLEFVTLEDIPTGACQRGGTWERLLYVLDRSEHEYTIQLDADTLTVTPALEEVVHCVETNTPFTLSDGFEILPLHEVIEEAEATPSDYIGIHSERAFARYPDQKMLYVRGSSGFAGFSHGGFTREKITRFHQEMEKLVGDRWQEWGTEQSGSNFAIANSPGAVVLPYPEYSSFTPHSPRLPEKFFHFIGVHRFRDNYYAARGQEVIASLRPNFAPIMRAKPRDIPRRDNLPLVFTRTLTWSTAVRYLAWQLNGKRGVVWVRVRSGSEFPGAEFMLRPRSATSNNDLGVAYEIFVHRYLQTPVRVPPERVKLIVDLGANVGMSCLYWLAAYWRAEVLAFEPHPGHAAQCRINLERNGLLARATLHAAAVGAYERRAWISDAGTASQLGARTGPEHEIACLDVFPLLAGRRIDILKVDIEGGEYEVLEDSRFGDLDIRTIVMEWHERDGRPGGYTWCRERLEKLGFQVYPIFQQATHGMFWAYRKRPATPLDDPGSETPIQPAAPVR